MDVNTVINILLFGVLIWLLSQKFLPAKGVKQITTTELKSLLKNKDVQFVDVRTPYEYQANRIRQFKNIPLASLGKQHTELSKDKEIVVICQSGSRSNSASRKLVKLGFKNVTNVRGGMITWN